MADTLIECRGTLYSLILVQPMVWFGLIMVGISLAHLFRRWP